LKADHIQQRILKQYI